MLKVIQVLMRAYFEKVLGYANTSEMFYEVQVAKWYAGVRDHRIHTSTFKFFKVLENDLENNSRAYYPIYSDACRQEQFGNTLLSNSTSS